jgi:MarR family transcriptional regulator, organic hydroperoxide resistance regulator
MTHKSPAVPARKAPRASRPPGKAVSTKGGGDANPAVSALSPADQSRVRLVFSLITLANVMRGNQEQFAGYMGVNVPRFLVLRVLEDAPGSTVTQIATRLEVTTQFVTLEARRLMEQGLVAKKPSDLDRRSVVLSLTPAGRRLVEEVRPLRRQANERMFRSLSADQVVQLLGTVSQLIEDGREALHELQAPKAQQRRAPSLRAVR